MSNKGRRKMKRATSRVVSRGPDGSRVVQLSPQDAREVERVAAVMARAFEERFGRPPGPDDPVFFDPDADEPRPLSSLQIADLERETVRAMRKAGFSEAYIYAWKKTGMLLTTDNRHLFTEEELDEFESAMNEIVPDDRERRPD